MSSGFNIAGFTDDVLSMAQDISRDNRELVSAVRKNSGAFIQDASVVVDLLVKYAKEGGAPDSVVTALSHAEVSVDAESMLITIEIERTLTLRDSLYKDKYRDQVDILSLYDEGYDASSSVYGNESGNYFDKKYPSRTRLEGIGFINAAAEKASQALGCSVFVST